MKILAAAAQSSAGDSQRAVYKDDLDLAIIERTHEVLTRLVARRRPFPVHNIARPPLQRSWAVVSGWPARKNTYDAGKRICNFDTCYHVKCPLAPADMMRKAGWNDDIHFGLPAHKTKDFVDDRTGRRVHLPTFEGLSRGRPWLRASQQNAGCRSSAWS